MTDLYVPKKRDIGLLFNRAVILVEEQSEGKAIFDLVEGKGRFTHAQITDFKLLAVSIERIKERDEKIISLLLVDYERIARANLSEICSEAEIHNIITEMKDYYQRIFKGVD